MFICTHVYSLPYCGLSLKLIILKLCRGAKVAGQREWGWVQQEVGSPDFPRDYPGTEATAADAKERVNEQVCNSRTKLVNMPAPLLLTADFVDIQATLLSC